ncbi:Tip elongation aberrant protein 1 [Neolecta irregularis DAH-3]|uniref:Tip elongation aberrant protein 1 n=1 Tax=Neolecta irregularis (strain DAH-3) TaxID=1198029 RepID=A0A1U7LHR6_NEOID|nr:Tip elongation aberrant protein 1 [Neolecta irregularis DAH-3]|eukprot:OLL22195.1 Tip elongation aberrant protein 1 [Neolecta irregularis DAH-3]
MPHRKHFGNSSVISNPRNTIIAPVISNLQSPILPVSAPVRPPTTGAYWHKTPFGSLPRRAHSATLVGDEICIFGGCDRNSCFNTLFVLSPCFYSLTQLSTYGTRPPPLRAHTITPYNDSLILFGGGDGSNYHNALYLLHHRVWKKIDQKGDIPSPRRAHTAVLHQPSNSLLLYGGGDGARALDDMYSLNLASWTWSKLSQKTRPKSRGYHTADLIGDKMVVTGGSDGVDCFDDIHIYDIKSNSWSLPPLSTKYKRLSHSSVRVGSYLFIFGGHNGYQYNSELLLFNLVTLEYETKKIYGSVPEPRGYASLTLYNNTLYLIGGFDGSTVFDQIYALELGASAYLSQIDGFQVGSGQRSI